MPTETPTGAPADTPTQTESSVVTS
jgi:hypothetical protein